MDTYQENRDAINRIGVLKVYDWIQAYGNQTANPFGNGAKKRYSPAAVDPWELSNSITSAKTELEKTAAANWG